MVYPKISSDFTIFTSYQSPPTYSDKPDLGVHHEDDKDWIHEVSSDLYNFYLLIISPPTYKDNLTVHYEDD